MLRRLFKSMGAKFLFISELFVCLDFTQEFTAQEIFIISVLLEKSQKCEKMRSEIGSEMGCKMGNEIRVRYGTRWGMRCERDEERDGE